jgi:hypothetical protein
VQGGGLADVAGDRQRAASAGVQGQ